MDHGSEFITGGSLAIIDIPEYTCELIKKSTRYMHRIYGV